MQPTEDRVLANVKWPINKSFNSVVLRAPLWSIKVLPDPAEDHQVDVAYNIYTIKRCATN